MTEEPALGNVVFADVVGSTTLGEQLDAEDVRAMLASYYAIRAMRAGGFCGDAEGRLPSSRWEEREKNEPQGAIVVAGFVHLVLLRRVAQNSPSLRRLCVIIVAILDPDNFAAATPTLA